METLTTDTSIDNASNSVDSSLTDNLSSDFSITSYIDANNSSATYSSYDSVFAEGSPVATGEGTFAVAEGSPVGGGEATFAVAEGSPVGGGEATFAVAEGSPVGGGEATFAVAEGSPVGGGEATFAVAGGGSQIPVAGGGSQSAVGGSQIPVAGGGSQSAVGGSQIPVAGGGSQSAVGGSQIPVAVGGSQIPVAGGGSQSAVGGSPSPVAGVGSPSPVASGSTSSNPFANSFGSGSQGNTSQGIGLGTSTTNTFAGAANNPYAGGGGQPFASLGNVVVGDNKWIIGKEITPERFSKVINYTVGEMVDSVIVKLSDRVYEHGITTYNGGNPFAGGNNPFGTTNAPAQEYLKAYGVDASSMPASASNFVTSVYSQTLPSGATNPTATGTTGAAGATPVTGGANAGASGGNPMVPSNNTSITSSTMPQQPSVDIVQILFGDDLKGGSGSKPSTSETLRIVQDDLLNFTKSVNSVVGKKLFSTNNTPLKSPDNLLTLYKNDILSANTPIANVNDKAGGGDPYTSLFGGSGNQSDIQPPTDMLSTVLGGLLPFSGTDNIFNTPEGGIPVGYGNKDFGSDNAVIGNANWNYGSNNASIGNANWHWDSSKNNATIGNGNWHLDSSQNNRTIGNGNWYWESTADNVTLGNGNWSFGNNNTTIGNGNWDYGSNNTIIGNGNQVFTSNSIVIGNGNWSVIIDKSNTSAGNFLGKLDTLVLSMGIKDAADNLVDSLMGKFAGAFQPLTHDLSQSAMKTYDQQFFLQGTVG